MMASASARHISDDPDENGEDDAADSRRQRQQLTALGIKSHAGVPDRVTHAAKKVDEQRQLHSVMWGARDAWGSLQPTEPLGFMDGSVLRRSKKPCGKEEGDRNLFRRLCGVTCINSLVFSGFALSLPWTKVVEDRETPENGRHPIDIPNRFMSKCTCLVYIRLEFVTTRFIHRRCSKSPRYNICQ